MINIFDYHSIYFDLDYTIWDGCQDEFWAKKLQPPLRYYFSEREYIYDSVGHFIMLQPGFKKVIKQLAKLACNLSFITRGGCGEDVPFEEQKVILCLNEFGLLDYFNHEHIILTKDDHKSEYLPEGPGVLFIDDNDRDLNDVRSARPKITCLDRKSFDNWEELL